LAPGDELLVMMTEAGYHKQALMFRVSWPKT
jgi:hypothetical protein